MTTSDEFIPARSFPDPVEPWTCGHLALAVSVAATAAAIGFGVVFAIGSRLIGGRG